MESYFVAPLLRSRTSGVFGASGSTEAIGATPG
jgi:hypothetical protein